jgi:hypothetical protein
MDLGFQVPIPQQNSLQYGYRKFSASCELDLAFPFSSNPKSTCIIICFPKIVAWIIRATELPHCYKVLTIERYFIYVLS